MIRMYSKKLLMPFVGVLQVADMGEARALSADGVNWAIQYALPGDLRSQISKHMANPSSHYTLVATIERGQLEIQPVHPFLDADEVNSVIDQLFQAVTSSQVPFLALDHYEYWLMDHTDGTPLALLQSTVDEEDMALPPPHPTWLAMPAAQLKVKEPQTAQNSYIPPVNYRLQKLIEDRAGPKPHAAWFRRAGPAKHKFPPCLIREDWEDEEHRKLCNLYIQRLAPRLLMIHGLSQPVRQRLEQCARDYVFEVERFFPLYPEVIDNSIMNAARVEAKLRRANNL